MPPDTEIARINITLIKNEPKKQKGGDESMAKTTKIRPNTKLARAGLYLLKKGSVYKQDLMAYANGICSDQPNASALVRELKERDIIALRDFTIREKRYVASEDKKPDSYYRKVETAKTATLTDYGMEVMYQFYVESLHGDDPAPRAYFEKLREPFLADITQLSDDAYREVLNQYDANRIKTIFNIAGVQTEPVSKPCLEQIYRYRNNLEYEGEYSEGYKLYQDDDRLDKRLDEGIYYTASEYREFYARNEGGNERYSSIARGIYISNSITLVVYANGRGNKSMIYCPYQTSEQQLILALKNENLSHRVRDKNVAASRTKEVCALLIGESDSFIYSTGSGKKHGRTTKGHKNNNYRKKLLTPYSDVFVIPDLSANKQDYYSNLYCIAYNRTGLGQLKKLLSETNLDFFYKELTEEYPEQFAEDEGNQEFPVLYKDKDRKWKSCCYIPCYELTLLAAISQQQAQPIIIASPDMRGIIQRVTHQKHLFLDPDEFKPDKSAVMTIDKNGYPAGKKIIDDYLHSNFKRTTQAEYRKAAERYDLDITEFFNAIAEERIDIEEAVEEMALKEYDPTRYARQAKKNMYVNKDCYEQIVALAGQKNTTIYHVTNMLLKKALSEYPDLSQADEQQET